MADLTAAPAVAVAAPARQRSEWRRATRTLIRNRLVLAGPVEATAIGNVLVQALGVGALGSLADAREVVRRSFEVRTFSPRQTDAWQDAYERFRRFRVARP